MKGNEGVSSCGASHAVIDCLAREINARAHGGVIDCPLVGAQSNASSGEDGERRDVRRVPVDCGDALIHNSLVTSLVSTFFWANNLPGRATVMRAND